MPRERLELPLEWLCEWVRGVSVEMLPEPPYTLAPGVTILDWSKYLETIQRETETRNPDPSAPINELLHRRLCRFHVIIRNNAATF